MLRPLSTRRRTLPPLPPFPPYGPPRGQNFSRRKATMPLPPSPACTLIVVSSISSSLSLVIVRNYSIANAPDKALLEVTTHSSFPRRRESTPRRIGFSPASKRPRRDSSLAVRPRVDRVLDPFRKTVKKFLAAAHAVCEGIGNSAGMTMVCKLNRWVRGRFLQTRLLAYNPRC